MRTITRKKFTCIIGLSIFFLLSGWLQGEAGKSNVFLFASESALPEADECAQPLSWSEEDNVSSPTREEANETLFVPEPELKSMVRPLPSPQTPVITTVSFTEDVKVAQKSFFGRFGLFGGPDPGSEKENRPFLNAETRPYSQPQKSTDVTSQFVLDPKKDERAKADKVIPEQKTDNSEQESNAKKSSVLVEISNQTLVNKELIAIDPDSMYSETMDAEITEVESDLQQLDNTVESSTDSLSEITRAELAKQEPVKLDPKSVGNPHSSTLVRLMYDEVISGLRSRQIIGRYDMFRRYCNSILDRYAGTNTGNERDGLYRLSWYDHLFRDPIKSIFEIEEFSRSIHAGLSGDHRHFAATLPIIREKLDVPPARNITIQFSKAQTPQQAVAEVRNCMIKAQAAYTKAIATLTPAEQKELAQNLYPIFCQNTINGHTIPQRKNGRRLVSLLQKMDRTGIHEALESLTPLTDENFLRLLAELPEDAFTKVSLGGKVVQKVSTPIGDIIIGGRDDNVYDLDAPGMSNVVCVIDLGGNDTFKEGTCTVDRPVFVIISLGGNDKFIATKPGVQGGSILGISMLLNLKGKNTYQAGDVAQGSTLGGVGVLIDYDGDTSYKAMRHAQGYALGGVGLLIDRKGNDKYRAALLAQGVGHPGGFAVLEDCEGNDHYYVGGKYLDSYEEHPGYDGWGQGLGAGIRQVANGGIGCLLDGEGDDSYEFDYFAHGGGYWFGIGFARDFKGNDKRHGATLLDYNGNPRSEARWQRFCSGFGCHYSIGALFDDEGDDTYGGTIMGNGMAWDLSAGFLCDFSGNDRFEATGSMSQGCGAQAGIGVLFNYGGNSTYLGNSQGYANSMMSYHDPSDAGSNFSFLIDYGGHDTYGGRDLNNTYQQRGGSGGFLIDRPFDVDVAAEKAAAQKAAAEQKTNVTATQRNNVQQSQPQRYDAYGRPIRSSQQQQRRPATNSFRGF